MACTGLGFAYLSAGLFLPLETVQTLAQVGRKDVKGKKREVEVSLTIW